MRKKIKTFPYTKTEYVIQTLAKHTLYKVAQDVWTGVQGKQLCDNKKFTVW